MWFLVLIFTSHLIFAKTTPKGVETDREIVSKARQLLLQKERQSAIALLVSAAQREEKKSNLSAVKTLAAALDEISTAFISDKAQQSYELGLTLEEHEPAQAYSKFEEAARLEPKNYSIEIEMVRMDIVLGRCSDALTKAKTLSSMNPYSNDVSLVVAQAALCSGDTAEFKKNLTEANMNHDETRQYWDLLKAQELLSLGNYEGARERLKAILKSDDSFPETHYWLWKVEMKLRTDARTPATKYLSMCKNPGKNGFRAYLREPMTCRRTAEVEGFQKKMEN